MLSWITSLLLLSVLAGLNMSVTHFLYSNWKYFLNSVYSFMGLVLYHTGYITEYSYHVYFLQHYTLFNPLSLTPLGVFAGSATRWYFSTLGELVMYGLLSYVLTTAQVLLVILLIRQLTRGLLFVLRIGRENASRFLLGHFVTSRSSPSKTKEVFTRSPMTATKPRKSGTSHPVSAATRSMIIDFIAHVCGTLGRPLYDLQSAPSRTSVYGLRVPYGLKDLTAVPRADVISPNDVAQMIDVDFHLPLDAFPVGNDMILYTIIPEDAAAVQKEFCFAFNTNNELLMAIEGGARYQHQLWDWSEDYIYLPSPFGSWYVYEVIRRRVSYSRYVVLLLYKSWVPFWNPIKLTGKSLTRLRPVNADGTCCAVNVLKSTKSEGYVSVAAPIASHDDLGEVSVRVNPNMMAKLKIEADKVSFSNALIRTRFAREGLKISDIQAAALCVYIKRKPEHALVIPVAEAVRTFYWKSNDEPTRIPMYAYMPPIVDGGFVPADNVNNARDLVKNRIVALQARPEQPVDHLAYRFNREYQEYIVPDDIAHTCHPDPIDTVLLRQNRPTQRSLIEKACDIIVDLYPRHLSTFMKAEAYLRPNNARNITTLPVCTKLAASQFQYPVGTIFAAKPWYMFKRTPLEIATRVADVCSGRSHFVSLDYARLDGGKSSWDADVNLGLKLRCYPEEFHEDIIAQTESLEGAEVHLSAGPRSANLSVDCDSGFSQKSGAPDTSDANTTSKAGSDVYHALRRTKNKVTGHYHTPTEAQRIMDEQAVIAGDDAGLAVDAAKMDPMEFASNFIDVAKMFRGTVTMDLYSADGADCVEWCGRVYGPRVWCGDNTSMCQIRRQLSKLHLTTTKVETLEERKQKAREKFTAYGLTDGNTPILCAITSVLRQANQLLKDDFWNDGSVKVRDVRFWARHESSVQFPNTFASWMTDRLLEEMPDFDLTVFNAWEKAALDDPNLVQTWWDHIQRLPNCWSPDDVGKKALTDKPDTEGTLIERGEIVEPTEPREPASEGPVAERHSTVVREKVIYPKRAKLSRAQRRKAKGKSPIPDPAPSGAEPEGGGPSSGRPAS